uniref:Uncharacterized protein n=1 Tax=Romanomermis culicivorax TaxID=13658 RepID=A0A915IE55_ROMCU
WKANYELSNLVDLEIDLLLLAIAKSATNFTSFSGTIQFLAATFFINVHRLKPKMNKTMKNMATKGKTMTGTRGNWVPVDEALLF